MQPPISYESTCKEGLDLMNAGEFEKAEECFRFAEFMIPGRLYATFCLFELYKVSGNPKVEMQAEKVINKEVISIGNATLRMKALAKEYLEIGACDI